MASRRIALIASLAVLLAACGGPVPTPTPPTASPPPSGPTATATAPVTPTPPPTPAPTVGVARQRPPAIVQIPQLTCPFGSAPSGPLDYLAGVPGGNDDLEEATREIRGVRFSDVIAIEGDTSAVVRDGRGVFIGRWFRSSSGGWLVRSYEACLGSGIELTPPRAFEPDAIAEVLVDNAVIVRSNPGQAALPVAIDAALRRGDQVFIVDGPVRADGSDWYLVRAIEGLASGSFGWVAATSPAGAVWIDDRDSSTCPTLPGDALRLGVLPEELLVHCFGGAELAFELEANVYCLSPQAGSLEVPVEPAWFSPRCGSLSGDACGSCDIPLAVDPQFGALPREDHALWSFSGHFDDPAAASCGPVVGTVDALTLASIVLRCRTTFVLTSLVRLGDPSG